MDLGWPPPFRALRLPCRLPQLRRLVVAGAALSLAADSGPGLAVLPALRSLSLARCEMSANSLALLGSAPVTLMHFDRVSLEEAADQQQTQLSNWEHMQQRKTAEQQRAQRFGAAVASLLAHLPLLVEVELCVQGIDLTSAATAQLSVLRKLHLTLVSETGEVHSRRVHAAALANLRSLEDLKMCQVLLVARDANLAHSTTPAATAELMSALKHLTRLQLLELDDVGLTATTEQQLAQFSALTSCSTQLRTLRLAGLRAQPLPRGALRRAFPAGRQLPQLQELVVTHWEYDPPSQKRNLPAFQHLWCVSAADLAAVAAACTGLQLLSLCGVLAPQPEVVGALAQLQQQQLHLPTLTVSDWNGWLTDESASALGQMSTSLRDLCIGEAPLLTDVGLACVTQLTALTRLTVSLEQTALSEEVLVPCGGYGKCRVPSCPFCNGEFEMNIKCEDDGPPVWRQLAARLRPSPLLAGRAEQQPLNECAGCKQLRQELQDHAEQLQDLRAELATLRAERAGDVE